MGATGGSAVGTKRLGKKRVKFSITEDNNFIVTGKFELFYRPLFIFFNEAIEKSLS